MNFEVASAYESWPEDLSGIGKELFSLKNEITWEQKEASIDMEFIKDLSQKLRSYGIDNIKNDIKKSTTFTPIFGNTDSGSLFSEEGQYSALPLNVLGKDYTVNFVHHDKNGDLGRHNGQNNQIFIDIASCEDTFPHDIASAKNHYQRKWNTDIYDYISWIVAHEKHHQDNVERKDYEHEEANAEVGPLKVIGVPYLLKRLRNSVSQGFAFSRAGDKRAYKDWYHALYNRYDEALHTVLRWANKEIAFQNAKKPLIDHLKTWRVLINGKKVKNTIEKNWREIRQGYYYDEKGMFKHEAYHDDFDAAMSSILTSDILKKTIDKYLKLSHVT